MGTIPEAGVTVACDKSLLGRMVDIAGIGLRTCHDTGGAITADKIDLYVGSIQEAKSWGVRKLSYQVIN